MQVYESFMDAQSNNDVEALLATFAPGASWYIPGDPGLVPWVGARDRAGIADYQVAITANATPTSFSVQKVLVDGEDLVALGRFGFSFASGGSLEDPFAIHFVIRDGLIHEFSIHEDSLNLAREFTGTAVVSAP